MIGRSEKIIFRFGISAVANLLKNIISFLTGLIIARELGPSVYGEMMFLLGTFLAFRQVLDMGTSTAFFTFISQRERSWLFIKYYFIWLGVQFIVPFLALSLVFPAAWIELIWINADRRSILLAFVAAFAQSIMWSNTLRMGESQRQTYRVQLVSLSCSLVHIIFIIIATLIDRLEVQLILILISVEWVIASVIVLKRLEFSRNHDQKDAPYIIWGEYWNYCRPLILFSWVGFVYEFLDRWLLQTYAGSIQQAYYSVAQQFGMISALATTAILNILWKEIAEANQKGDHTRLSQLYENVSKAIFFTAAVISGLLAPWSQEILLFTLGEDYQKGYFTLMLLLFFPIHQGFGQILITMAYATGEVKIYVRITYMFLLASMVATYFVLAPKGTHVPGLGMGSSGLAGKMLILQLIQVNALAYYLSRKLNLKFNFWFQFIIIFVCVGAGFLARAIPFCSDILKNEIWISFLISVVIYLFIILLCVILYPQLFGLKKQHLVEVLYKVKKQFRGSL